MYFLGSPLRAAYPLVPLFHNQAVGIAVFSCNGTLFWGFNVDWDAVPDVHELVEGVAKEFARLKRAAGVELPAKVKTATSAREGQAGGPPPAPAGRRSVAWQSTRVEELSPENPIRQGIHAAARRS